MFDFFAMERYIDCRLFSHHLGVAMYNQVMITAELHGPAHTKWIRMYAFRGGRYVCFVQIPARYDEAAGSVQSGADVHNIFAEAIGRSMDRGLVRPQDVRPIMSELTKTYRRFSMV